MELGDVVTVGTGSSCEYAISSKPCAGQCRSLSKMVRLNVLRVAKNKAAAKTFGKF